MFCRVAKENTYFEQPHVQYEYKVILLLSGTQITDISRYAIADCSLPVE